MTNERVRSAHEIAIFVKINIRCDIQICRKFLCVTVLGPGGAGLTSFYCNFTYSVLLIRNLLNGCPVFSCPPPPPHHPPLSVVPSHIVQFPNLHSSTP